MADFVLGYTGQQVQDTLDEVYKIKSDIEYQTPTIVGTQVRLTKQSDTKTLKFYLSTELSGGAITISIDGGVTDVALKDGEGNAVTELTAGLKEVVYVAPFFILRSSGGLQEFFGDGSDGTIPNLNTITTAPNGGSVANLWDMNAGTVFTTGTLSSASDQVVFSIDFGKPTVLGSNFTQQFSGAVISTGANRNLNMQCSDDGISWTSVQSVAITTSSATQYITTTSANIKRYWRFVLLAGGSNCTFSCTSVILNSNSLIGGTDNLTNKVWRILEPSTLNGAAVVKQYTEYVLPVGYEHTTQNPCQGLIIYSQGNATVNGILDMSQKAGLAPNGNAIPMLITKKAYKTAKTSSLLHFDNNITDDNGRVWTNNGGATFDATNKKFGTHAINISGPQWLDTPASNDFNFGYGDFTVDCWIRPNTIGAERYVCAVGDTNSNVFWGIYINSSGNVIFKFGTNTLTSNTVLIANNWFHVSVVKYLDTLYLYINGISESYVKISNINTNSSNNKLAIGRLGETNTGYWSGQIDEFRIIKGKAMYTTNFTPPTSAYVYQATYVDEPKTLEKYFQLTNVLQTLRGGYGGNGGYGGGYSGSTGRQTSVGIGGAGRQNLGGFGGGGSGGGAPNTVGGIGGSILNAEIGGGFLPSCSVGIGTACNGLNGCGAFGRNGGTVIAPSVGICLGGGTGGLGGTNSGVPTSSTSNSQYSGGFLMFVSNGNFINNGTIRSNGGTGSNGSEGTSTNAGGGGAGGGSGGGVIALFYGDTYSNTGTVQVNGGAGGIGGASIGTGEAGSAGTSGSVGTIHTQKI